MTQSNKPGIAFWIIGILALIWNGIGVLNYLGRVYMTDEQIQALDEANRAYLESVPAWVTAAFATSVFAAFIGCIGLLMRKKWSVPLFVLSLLAVLAQSVHTFFIQDAIAMEGATLGLSIAVIVISIFLVWYSKNAKNKGILS